MLSYVFWHWPKPEIPREEYENRLSAFHQVLGENRPAGLTGSSAWRIEGAPWLPAGPSYEDWYLLEDTCALDSIAAAAVSGSVGSLHDPIAALAAGGTAGLYKPVRAVPRAPLGNAAAWFSRPDGMTYRQLYMTLGLARSGDTGPLWQRMLTLGPTPEFCLLGEWPVRIPGAWQGISVRRTLVSP